MRDEVTFARSPPISEWVSEFVADGWKSTEHTDNTFRAKKAIGASEYPVRLATTWFVTVRYDENDDVTVIVDVPTFTDSVYAKYRIRSFLTEMASSVGASSPNRELSIDVLRCIKE